MAHIGQARTRPRTLLGFDYGRNRIGVAVGQELTATARPLVTLPTRNQRPDWDAIARLIEDWRPDLLIVGVPYHADGSGNSITALAQRFSRQLTGRYGLAVDTIDERLSSLEAEKLIARFQRASHRRDKSLIDQVAAAVILETWFNHHKASSACQIPNS